MNHASTAFRYALIVAFGGFVFGLDAALISGTVRFVTTEFGLSDLQVGTVVSAPGFGVIFALLVTGTICARLGRKKTLIGIALLYIVSAVCSVFAPSFELLVAARFLGGLAFTSLSLASMYIGEIAPSQMRGKLVSANQINIVIGLSAAFFANDAILQASQSGAQWVEAVGITTYTWRWMLGIEIVPAVIWLLLLFTIPESPRWLVQQGRLDEARDIMRRLMPEDQVEAEIAQIEASVDSAGPARSVRDQLVDLLDPRIRRTVLLGLTVAIVQPITGINAILFYAPTVFEQTGIGTNAAFAQAVIVGVASVIATGLALVLIDRIGRRPMTLFGLAWAGISLGLCAWAFSNATYVLDPSVASSLAGVPAQSLDALINVEFSSDVEFKRALKAAIGEAAMRSNESVLLQNAARLNVSVVLIGIVSFIAAFNFSIGPVMWVLFSEIFPISVRSIAIPVFALITSVVSYLVQQFFPWQLNTMGAAQIFAFYTACVVMGLIILWRIMPETKNKTIEEIEAAMLVR